MWHCTKMSQKVPGGQQFCCTEEDGPIAVRFSLQAGMCHPGQRGKLMQMSYQNMAIIIIIYQNMAIIIMLGVKSPHMVSYGAIEVIMLPRTLHRQSR